MKIRLGKIRVRNAFVSPYLDIMDELLFRIDFNLIDSYYDELDWILYGTASSFKEIDEDDEVPEYILTGDDSLYGRQD